VSQFDAGSGVGFWPRVTLPISAPAAALPVTRRNAGGSRARQAREFDEPAVPLGSPVTSSNVGDVTVAVTGIDQPESAIVRLTLRFANASDKPVVVAVDYSFTAAFDAAGERYPVIRHQIERAPGWTLKLDLAPGGTASHWMEVVAPPPTVRTVRVELATPSNVLRAARFEPFILRLPSGRR
jgi:hypothetical protein